ncbi:unnamed protein product [Camellia sinensis]
MALRFMPLLGSRVKPCLKIGGLWGPLSKTPWIPSSSCFQSYGYSIPALASEAVKTLDDKALCGGTSIYKGAHKDDWIITLAKFAVTKHNEKQWVVGASHTGASCLLYHITLVATDARRRKIFHTAVWLQLWRNLMELLVWKPVNDALSAIV